MWTADLILLIRELWVGVVKVHYVGYHGDLLAEMEYKIHKYVFINV